MKLNSLLAFALAIVALLMVLGLVGFLVYDNLFRLMIPEYCEHFSLVLDPEESDVDLKIGEGKLVKMDVRNEGFEDEFKVTVEGPGWIIARPAKLRLNQGETGEVFIYMSPSIGSSGSYDAILSVQSYCGSVEEQIKLKVSEN